MKVVEPSARVIDTIHQDPYRAIEIVGRLCYKSEEKMTDSSASKFVSSMYKSNHHAMLEHYHVMIRMSPETFNDFIESLQSCGEDNFTNLTRFLNITHMILTPSYTMSYVSGSFRAFIDVLKYLGCTAVGHALGSILNAYFPELFPDYALDTARDLYFTIDIVDWDSFKSDILGEEWLSDDQKNKILSKHLPLTVIFKCDRGVSHELVRHRDASFGQESTRYCDYSLDKFNKTVSFIKPCFFEVDSVEYGIWEDSCIQSEKAYFALLELRRTPQEARAVLDNSVKTEIGVTATENEWQHIVNLRYHGTTGKPHPQMVEVMSLAYPRIVELTEGRVK